MKLRHHGLIKLVALLASWLIRIWIGSLRFRLIFLDGKKHPTDARVDPNIYVFWHEVLLFPAAFKGRGNFLISTHADGELIARVCKHLGGGVVRGSTTRGGVAGLKGMVEKSKGSHLLITPDGPRGPRRRLQMGAVLLASLTGLPLVPVGLTFAPAWRVGNWDRMMLPRPWSSAFGVVGIPVHVPPTRDRQELERFRLLVEDEMNRLTEAAETWAEGVRPATIAPVLGEGQLLPA